MASTKFDHLRIPLKDVVNATDNFHRDNIIGRGDFGTAYKGEFSWSGKWTKITVRRLDRKRGLGDSEFWTEVSMLSELKHTNLVSMIGFCEENGEMIIVTTYHAKGSLKEHLNNPNLTWTQRLRIALGVARALSYLHSYEGRGYSVIHRLINSSTVLLDEKYEAKLTCFEMSIKQSNCQKGKVVICEPIGIIGYVDPAIESTIGVTHKSDIYSFGVLLFEILCGKEAFIPNEAHMHLAPLAKSHYEKKTLQDIIHPRLWNKISYHQSLVKYSEIAYSCLNDERACRPDADYIVDELEKALEFLLTSENTDDTLQPLGIDQVVNKFEKSLELKSTDKNTSKNLKKNHKKNHRMSLGDITQATQNFHKDNCIGGGGFGRVYKGKLQDGVGFKTIVAKRLDPSLGQGEQQFLCELQILLQYKHENVIGLVGYCAEKDEKIIVYEYASKGSLDRYLNDACLTWVERLNICIDVASALDFLHGGAEKQAKVIHRDIKSANILLDNDWKARLADFGLSLISPLVQDTDYVIDHWCGTPGYSDPFYKKSRFLTIESDIYSFGVVLFEILCGRSTSTIKKHEALYLPEFVKNRFEEGTHNEVVFEQIRKRIMPKSLTTFQEIAYQCLEHEREKRPTTKQVLMKLKNALELQNMASTLAKFDDLRIPLKDVEKATNNFHHDKITLHGNFVRVYKGRLLRFGKLMKIRARRFDYCKNGEADLEFLREFLVYYDLKQTNPVSIIGFCDEKDEKIIAFRHVSCVFSGLVSPFVLFYYFVYRV